MALALQPSTATLSTRPPTPDHQNQPARVLHLDAAAVDQLDAVAVGVAHEAEQRAAFSHAIRLSLGLDSLILEPRERLLQIVHGQRDMSVPCAEVVRATVVVERQLELLVLTGDAEKIVRGLLLAVPDDVHLAPELEPERLVEGAALPGVGDPHHGVQIARHDGIVRRSPSRASTTAFPAACAAECPVTAARKSARRSAYSRESTVAVTVAVRGTSRSNAISPK